MRLLDFKEELHENLRNPEYAAHYLQAAYEDSYGEFLYALRELVVAYGGMTALAQKIGKGRCGLYRSLSREGRPQFDTVIEVLQSVGLKLAVIPQNGSEGDDCEAEAPAEEPRGFAEVR